MPHHPVLNHAFGAAHTWTGRVTIELRNATDHARTSLEAKVCLDTVQLWFGERSVADLDRDIFREWLIRPHEQNLAVDNVDWSLHKGLAQLTIDETNLFTVSHESLGNLLAVI